MGPDVEPGVEEKTIEKDEDKEVLEEGEQKLRSDGSSGEGDRPWRVRFDASMTSVGWVPLSPLKAVGLKMERTE